MRKKKVKKGSFYFVGTTAHEKNEKELLFHPLDTVHNQVFHAVTLEQKRKLVQFIVIFTLLSLGRPMSDFESMRLMLEKLRFQDSPKTHWSPTSGWEMVENLFHIVQLQTRVAACEARFLSLFADEVTTIDNSPWFSIHLYVVRDWERILVLLSLQKLKDGVGVENVIAIVMDALTGDAGNLGWNEVAKKVVCFGADGALVFQGHRTTVIAQLDNNHAPFMQGMHCCAHHTNLCVEKMVKKIETLCHHLYSYFAHSSKW